MVKRKVSLGGDAPKREGGAQASPSNEVVDVFFNTGVVFHELDLQAGLPDVVSGFVTMKDAAGNVSVRRAAAGEEPDVEISAVEHLAELSHRWLPVPYQLSCAHAVQIYLAPDERDPAMLRGLLAIDTLESAGSQGKRLDAAVDAGRPFRALDKDETSAFLDHAETRELLRRLERLGVEKATFKLAALLDTLSPLLPRLRFSRVEEHAAIPVSLVLDFGNSRSSAVLVEAREKGLFAIPLAMREQSNPLRTSDETFDSRVTFLPPPFDRNVFPVAVGDSFATPSIVKMGKEALDRALETPHRYQCTLSSPKRYLWESREVGERWHFATPIDASGGGHPEHKPVFGRVLKYVVEDQGGIALRQDGPSSPADPRYAPRAMMLFAMIEILSQAYAQINSAKYRAFQGKEQSPRVLAHVSLTFPSAMREEEKTVYEALVRNAVSLTSYLFNVPRERQPNWNAQLANYEPFLFTDEALAAQMVYLYQEVGQNFAGSFEELVSIYGRKDDGALDTLRVASVDIGGGTSDVMIAEYTDKQPGTGTSLGIKKLFQDGVSVAGDEVCRAIVEDIVLAQVLTQLPTPASRAKLAHLFGEGDGGHGAAWRTLRSKLVPYFWLPLARCYWALAEGFEPKDHADGKLYRPQEIFALFGSFSWSPAVVEEADKFLASAVPEFPGLSNVFLRLDRGAVETTAMGVLREPLRRYADIIAQFDVDVLVLAGRTSALKCVRDVFVSEMTVSPARVVTMSSYAVGEWYPSKWQEGGRIKDPKSTVTAGATVLHLASKNRLPGFVLDTVTEAPRSPIYGLYQESEPHISKQNELFRGGKTSGPFLYTSGMMVGFRNVDSEEMDGSPLFEVRAATADVEAALLEDRVSLKFALSDKGDLSIAEVTSQRQVYQFGKDDFTLALKTITTDRYWLDSGVFKGAAKFV